jgi:UDPglucose 6-dehydrogenase
MSNIVIIGSGVVGQATGKGFIRKGHSVTFVDVNPNTISMLSGAGLNASTIDAVNWFATDIVIFTVSTPTRDGHIVLDYLKAAAEDVGRGLAQVNHFITVVVRSTVPPTTTERVISPILQRASGKVAGQDFGVAMNPEFLRQVSSVQDFDRPWITVLGTTDPVSARVLKELYQPFGSLIVECTPSEAEMIKYTNNLYNAVKISYFNEIHAICQQLGIDSGVVGATVARSAESMWNPLYGTRGGVPYGGACLPKDTTAFMAFCDTFGFEHLMLRATIDVNERLSAAVPPAVSPDKMDLSLAQARAMSVNTQSPVAIESR